MEGLTSASDVIFLLTTNRADLLEQLSPSAQGGWTWPPSCPFPTLTRVAR